MLIGVTIGIGLTLLGYIIYLNLKLNRTQHDLLRKEQELVVQSYNAQRVKNLKSIKKAEEEYEIKKKLFRDGDDSGDGTGNTGPK